MPSPPQVNAPRLWLSAPCPPQADSALCSHSTFPQGANCWNMPRVCPFNPMVAGSSPARLIKKALHMRDFLFAASGRRRPFGPPCPPFVNAESTPAKPEAAKRLARAIPSRSRVGLIARSPRPPVPSPCLLDLPSGADSWWSRPVRSDPGSGTRSRCSPRRHAGSKPRCT